jgi:hypothetical protein
MRPLRLRRPDFVSGNERLDAGRAGSVRAPWSDGTTGDIL